MRRLLKITCLFLGLSILFGQSEKPPQPIIKEFTPAGRIEALVDGVLDAHLLLVHLDLKNDSLFNIVNTILPRMELFSGPASYHRIMTNGHVDKMMTVLTDEFYTILNDNYSFVTVNE